MGAPVVIFDPNGVPRHIPIEKAADALAHGGQRGILFNTPDGSQRWIPQNDIHKALQAGGYVADPVDLTINPPGANGQGEGTYKMARPNGDLLHVPYSMVGSAAKLGYVMDQSDRPTYVKDAAADKHLNEGPPMPYGIKIVGRNSAGQPILGSQSLFGDQNSAERFLSKAGEAIGGAVTGLYHGLVEGPQNPEEAKMEAEDPLAGPMDVRISRFITEPMKQRAQATEQSFHALRSDKFPEHLVNPTPEDVARAYAIRNDLYSTAGNALATAIPGVGPFAASLGEQLGAEAGAGDYASAAGSAVGNGLLVMLPDMMKPVTKVLAGAVTSLPEGVRSGIRNTLGVSEKTEDLVDQFEKDSQKVAEENKRIEESNREAQQRVGRARNRAAATHDKATEKYEKGKAEKQANYQQARKDWEAKRDEALRQHRQAREETIDKNKQALGEHLAERDKLVEDKAAAQRELGERQQLEEKIANDQRELTTRLEQAEGQAERVNDAMWDSWRDSVKGQVTSTKPIVDALKGAAQSSLMREGDAADFKQILKESSPADGNASQVAALRDEIAKAQGMQSYDSGTPAQKSGVDNVVKSYGLDPDAADVPEDVDATRIHVWKQQLERAVRAAEKAGKGNIAHAIGQVLDQVRKAEDDLTAKAGPSATAFLNVARESHADMARAFRDVETEPRTAAKMVKQEFAKEAAKAEDIAQALKRVGIHDPRLVRLAGDIETAQARLDEMRKPNDLQKIINAPFPKPPDMATPPTEESFTKKVGKEPEEPDHGQPPESVLNKPEELQPEGLRTPKQKPTQEMPTGEKIPGQIIKFVDRRLRRYGAVGGWVLRLIVGGEALHLLSEGHVSTFGSTVLIGQMGVTLLTDALRKDSILQWLAKPTEEELEMVDKLPPEDAARLRQALLALASAEVKRGATMPTINPAMAKFLLGTTAGQQPSLQQIQAEAAQRKPKAPVGAQPKGYTHIFDTDSGKILPVQ